MATNVTDLRRTDSTVVTVLQPPPLSLDLVKTASPPGRGTDSQQDTENRTRVPPLHHVMAAAAALSVAIAGHLLSIYFMTTSGSTLLKTLGKLIFIS